MELGISLGKAAADLGVSRTFINQIEAGTSKVPSLRKEQFEKYFGIKLPDSADYLKGFADGWKEGYEKARLDNAQDKNFQGGPA